MYVFATLFVFIFGTIIGSFLNVVILRYNTGMKFFGTLTGPKERSICFSCGKKLEWYELVPVFSFCFLGGKCSGCKSKISWQYPLVEIATGLLFVGILYKNFPVGSAFPSTTLPVLLLVSLVHATIWSLLLVITVYDFRHKIIPDGHVYAFIGFSFLTGLVPLLSGFSGTFLLTDFLWRIFAGLIFFGFFAGLWLVSGGRWLGFGDAKLVVGVGFLLGLSRGFTALTLAFWIGAVVSIFLLALSWILERLAQHKVVQSLCLRRGPPTLTMKSEIPFAPFIILGTLISFFWSFDFFAAVGNVLTF